MEKIYYAPGYPNLRLGGGIKFKNGFFTAETKEEVEKVESHKSFKVNFFEHEPATEKLMDRLGKAIKSEQTVVLPGAIDDDCKKAIEYLEKASSKMAPTQVDNVVKTVEEVAEKLQVSYHLKITKELPIKRIKARLVEFLFILKDAEKTIQTGEGVTADEGA